MAAVITITRRLCCAGAALRNRRVSVVGSGPAGFYTAEELLKVDPGIHVDILEKLHAPFGLVRYGVAPDHPEVKAVQNKFMDLVGDARVQWFGNVLVGSEDSSESSCDGISPLRVSVATLLRAYDAVVFASGCEGVRSLGIDGEDGAGIYHARDFVAFYNGHPHYQQMDFKDTLKDSERAVVVGNGNVALDVARVLMMPRDALRATDISSTAMNVIDQSPVRQVHILGRRGPVQAAWTNKEFREMFDTSDVYIADEAMDAIEDEDTQEIDQERSKKRMMKLLKQRAKFVPLSKLRDGAAGDGVYLHFLTSPLRALQSPSKRLSGLVCGENHLVGVAGSRKCQAKDNTSFELSCDVCFSSVGYQADFSLPLPYDRRKGTVSNVKGRVVDEHGNALPSLYVSGWIKRGPFGIVGTNKFDAMETADVICEDLSRRVNDADGKVSFHEYRAMAKSVTKLARGSDFEALQHRMKKCALSFEYWKKIDALERKNGMVKGKPREKTLVFDEALRAILQSQTS